MATARSMLRAVAQSSDYSPGEVLRRINDPLVMDMPPNMFVTCFYAILDPMSGSFTYANAGHDLPYLNRSGDAEELRARGMPPGAYAGDGLRGEGDYPAHGGALLLRWGGLGAGGRHNPPYATALRILKLNFGEFVTGEVRGIRLLESASKVARGFLDSASLMLKTAKLGFLVAFCRLVER
jgi:hypothetical protein